MLERFKKSKPAQQPEPTTRPAPTAPALTGVPQGLVSLAKKASVSLEKRGLTGQRAAVYLVIDRSYSMRDYYENGSVQHLADQVLGLSVNLDDDATVPLVMFDSNPYPVVEISLDRYQGAVADQHRLHGGTPTMGGTQYAHAMSTVVEHYRASDATDPGLVIFQTDGEPQDRDATRLLLAQASNWPLYWSFIGFGPRQLGFLDELVTLRGRTVGNAGYFHAGADPKGLDDSAVYDGITRGFDTWLAEARSQGVLPR